MRKDNAQAIFNLMAQIILNGTNFILIMIFTRFLSTDDYGTVSIFQTYSLFFAVIVGLNVQGSIGTAFAYFEKKERDDYLASIMLLAIAFFVIIIFVSALLIKPFSSFSELSPALIVLMLCYSFGSFSFAFANIKYVYSRQSQFSCLMALIVSASMTLLSWLGVKYQQQIDLELYLLRTVSISVPYIICAIYVLLTIFVQGNPIRNIKKYWHFCLPICIPLVFHSLSQIVLGQTDKIMIQKMLNDDSLVGIYSFIVTFVHIINSVYMALNNTWVPIYYDYTKNNEIELMRKRSERYSRLFLCLCMGFMFVSPELVKLFADRSYWGGISLIPFVILAIFFIFQYSFAVNYELYHRKTKWIALGTSSAAVCNIVFNALLIPQFKLYGAAIATLLSYLMLFLFHQVCAFHVKAETEYPYRMKFFVSKISIMVISSVIFVLIQNLFIVRWIIACCIGGYLLTTIYKNKAIF